MVSVEVIYGCVRHIRRSHFAHLHVVPREILKPRVGHKIVDATFGPYAILGLAHYAFIDEVCGLDRPASRNVSLFNLYLLTKYLFSDFAPVLSNVGSLAHHAFIADYTYSKIVRYKAVVLATQDLWGHVTRRS